MRCVISVLLTLAVSVPVSASNRTASVTAHCKSLVLSAAVAVTTNEVVTSAYFTTPDDRTVVPQHDALPDGMVRMSDELRPRTGQPGIYDVDYAVVSASDELIEYGSLMLRLASDDRDTNGAPDILESGFPGNSEITGTAHSDWPAEVNGTILGTLERETNVHEGSFAMTVSRSNRVFISGSFSLPKLTGQLEYSPSEPAQVTFRLSIQVGGMSSELMGVARCSVPNANEIALDRFTLRDDRARPRLIVLPTVLRRVGTKFVGPLEFNDGNPDTSWPDYMSWAVEIADPNDVNQNGVPDLSDLEVISDLALPTVRIATPNNGKKVTDEVISLGGTARDNIGVARVEYRVGSGAFLLASGTTDWTASVALVPGTNVVEVRAIDAKGNVSKSARRRVVYVTYAPLIFLVNGSGTVVPHEQGKQLEVDRSYTLRAIPNAGHMFSHWSGDVEGTQASLTFLMRTNLEIVANFVPNPFLSLAGSYEGLFSEAGTIRAESSGMIRLSLRPNGTYTARLIAVGKTNAIVGRFHPSGASTATLRQRGGGGRTSLQLQLDVDPGAEELTGTVASGGWTANLTAYRAAFGPGQNTNFASRYTIRIAGSGDGSQTPGGDGVATANVDANGKVKVMGKLADNTPFTFGTALSRSGAWPFFVATHRGKGVVLGWMRCASPSDIADAIVTWIRPATPSGRYYPNGFSIAAPVTGSALTNGVASSRMLLVASGGGLAIAVTNFVTLDGDGRYSAEDPSHASLRIQANTGGFNGHFLSAGSRVRFEGVMLPKYNYGAGYFMGASSVGQIRLTPAP